MVGLAAARVMTKQESTVDIDASKLLHKNWHEFTKRAWFVSFQRALNLCIFLIILHSVLFFVFDYSAFTLGQWENSARYQYVFIWRITYAIGLIPFLIIGRKIKPRAHSNISIYHKAYLYLFIPFLVFTGVAAAAINYKHYLGDLSVYTVSVVFMSAVFPIPNRYRETICIASLSFIIFDTLLSKTAATVDVVLLNASAVAVVSLFIQRLSNKYFQDSFIAIKLIEHQSEMFLRQKEVDLQLLEREKTIESIFYFIHNGPLQTLANTIRHARSLSHVDKELIHNLDKLNHEMRKINDSLAQEIIDDKHSYYLGDREKVDLNLPFDELLYEVYIRTLERDFQGFKDLKLKIPSFDTCDESALPNDAKKDACFFLEEALCNVGKHALGASRLEVIGQLYDGSYSLNIVDNGPGVQSPGEGEGTKRFIKIASELSGTFQRISIEPRGTLCQLKWPLGKS